MAGICRLGILSDIHYAGAAEQARGNDFDYRDLSNPLLRAAARFYRQRLWLRDPLSHNDLLDRFLEQAGPLDYVVANGDYTCGSGYIGLSDDAMFQSATECLGKLRQKFGANFQANYGDHELGKFSMFSRRGGMRLASLRRTTRELGMPPFWRVERGNYVLIGVVSSLVALPVFEADTLPEERPEWERVRAEHLAQIREAFAALEPRQRLLLFCHDPTALPFLWEEEVVRAKLAQLEQTILGHLHSNLVLWKSRILAGMPTIRFLGHAVTRLSTALHQARLWRPFKVRLCPSLAGIELLKDGGYYTADLALDAQTPARFQLHRLPRP